VASVLAERKQEIARLIAREMGKTIAEADDELDYGSRTIGWPPRT
jgi:acyl-CoA reductase-like NAD-dependent aldehyde dehydrogenase